METIEQLFVKEYEALKKENERLKEKIEDMNDKAKRIGKSWSEMYQEKLKLENLIKSLDLKLEHSDVTDKDYIYIASKMIWCGDEFYELAKSLCEMLQQGTNQ